MARPKKYNINLTEEELKRLKSVIRWIFRSQSALFPLRQSSYFRRFGAVISGTESTFVFA